MRYDASMARTAIMVADARSRPAILGAWYLVDGRLQGRTIDF